MVFINVMVSISFTEPISVTEKKKINSLEHWLEKKTLENSTCDTDFKQDSSTCTSQVVFNFFSYINVFFIHYIDTLERVKYIQFRIPRVIRKY
jgi:hypothetical protein